MPPTFEIAESESSLRFDLPDSVGLPKISIAIVDPDRERSKAVNGTMVVARTGTVRVVPGYLPTVQDAPWLTEQGFDMILVGLDGNTRDALRTVESLCTLSQAPVVVYSQRSSQDLLLEAMRSGAREFLTFPFAPGAAEDAVARVAARIQAAPSLQKTAGKILAFVGAKGGAGVTTVACNYAVALAQDSKKNTLLIDFDLPLGDAALDLGLTSEYSTADALREAERLDFAYLSRLIVRHSSGLSLLAAPGRFPHIPIDNVAANKLLTVACNGFDCVVIDAGSRLDWTRTHLFDLASRIYLVTQIGVPELRNANRMITGSIPAYGSKLEIVLNRYAPKAMGIDDGAIESALTMAPQWRIPNDYFAVREMQNRAEPLALANSPIARVIRKMAREISGLPQERKKKSLLGLFG
ncbi:MAG: CpaE family protein [Terracidiphilus sp.]